MLNSNFWALRPVILPYAGRQMYIHTFDIANPVMAPGYEDYLIPVKQLCASAGALHGKAHMTVDEKIVKAGMSQRRPKPHVDGCFIPEKSRWGGGGGWLHYCNDVGSSDVGRMAVIVAASKAGCRAWKGMFDAKPKPDGDLSHIRDSLGKGEVLKPHYGYLLSPDCVHESMLFESDTQRTFLRIALESDFIY